MKKETFSETEDSALIIEALGNKSGEREAELLLTLPEGTEVVEDLGRLPVPVRYVKRYYKKTGSEKCN